MSSVRIFLISALVFIVLLIAFFSGFIANDLVLKTEDFPLLLQAYDILQIHGLKDLPPQPNLEYGMIRGLIQAYDDPYTTFVEPPQHELEVNALQGKFGGIGVNLGNDAQGEWVLFPYIGSPATKAGIQEGDRLLIIDDYPVTKETPIDTLKSALRGPVGKRVNLTIGRPPEYTHIQVSVKRAEIPLPSVTWHLEPTSEQIGVVIINIIAESTPDEVQHAIEDLQARGASHFILDLRNTPGGLLTAGVEIARLFLNEGIVLQQQFRDKDVDTFYVEQPGPLSDIPLVVLINHETASASEIIAGALQAHKRALLIGTQSYAKDSVQLVFELKDKSSLHVTAARWWIPGLEPIIGASGLQPDIPVTEIEGESVPDPFIHEAILSLFGSLP